MCEVPVVHNVNERDPDSLRNYIYMAIRVLIGKYTSGNISGVLNQ